MREPLPVACRLTDRQLRARRKDYPAKAAESLIDSAELPDGFIYRFPLGEKTSRDLAEIIDLERKCCPFLNFKLTVEAGSDRVSLELSGAPGTKEIVRSLFNWN